VIIKGFAGCSIDPSSKEMVEWAKSPDISKFKAWFKGLPKKNRNSWWILLPTPKNQQEAAIRLGINPIYEWDKWDNIEVSDLLCQLFSCFPRPL
jgi:hypothetical protein